MNKETEFWNKFAVYLETQPYIDSLPVEYFIAWYEVMQACLQAHYKKLSLVLIGSKTIVISANNKKRYFKLAEKVVAKAPKKHKIKILALKPSIFETDPKFYVKCINGKDKPIAMYDIKIKLSSIGCELYERQDNPSKFKIIICSPDYFALPHDMMFQVLSILLQDVLGERMLARHIKDIEIAPVTEEMDDNNGIVPLYELRAYFENMFRE